MNSNLDKKFIKDIKYAIKINDCEALNNIFNKIYDEYAKLIKYVSFQIVRNNEDADDIMQETFINFFNNITKIDLTNIKYYLVRSAKNLSLNLIKSFNKKIELGFEDKVIVVEKKDSINDVIKELKKILSAEEIDIIIKHLIFNYTFKDIAKEYNTTTNVINSKYFRAVKKFKENNE